MGMALHLSTISILVILSGLAKRDLSNDTHRSCSMKKGDRATAMGVVGKIEEIRDTTVILSSVDGSKIEVLKMAISEVQGSDEATPEQK